MVLSEYNTHLFGSFDFDYITNICQTIKRSSHEVWERNEIYWIFNVEKGLDDHCYAIGSFIKMA